MSAVVAEATPIRFFSRHVFPLGQACVAFFAAPIQTHRCTLVIGPTIAILLVLFIQHTVKFVRNRRARFTFAGLHWERSTEGGLEFQPICNRCQVELQPSISTETRTDRNNIPFLFTPKYANTLICPRCNYSNPLHRSWDEVRAEAQAFFKSTSHAHSPLLPQDHRD